MKKHLLLSLLTLVMGLVWPHALFAQPKQECGVMVMAHGGSDEWNAAVEDAVSPLREIMPTEIAFGMADPRTLQEAVVKLEERGVQCIAVVRLFMSAHSFRHQTEYLLGLRTDPPRFFISDEEHGSHHGAGNRENPQPLAVQADILLNQEGLMDASEMGEVLAQRAMALSEGSGNESVLVIAHGAGDDAENDEWLRKLDELAERVRTAGSFISVEVHTLREDWEEKRVNTERRIRSFVESKSKNDGRVLVIPFRLFGFGPYEDVLEGLSYESNGMGLLPSSEVTDWIREQVRQTLAGRSADTFQ